MRNVLTKRDCFLYPDFKFPSNLLCSYIFNRVFQNGDSFKEIESYAISHAKSIQKYDDPNTSSLVQYNLESDIWGPKVVASLGVYKLEGLDYSIAHGCRDNSQFDQILLFLSGHRNVSVYTEEVGNITFIYQNAQINLLDQLVIINVQKERTQSIKIGITFKT